jgi:hypothetical protein
MYSLYFDTWSDYIAFLDTDQTIIANGPFVQDLHENMPEDQKTNIFETCIQNNIISLNSFDLDQLKTNEDWLYMQIVVLSHPNKENSIYPESGFVSNVVNINSIRIEKGNIQKSQNPYNYISALNPVESWEISMF